MHPLRIGIVGVGNISGIYFDNLKKFSSTEVVAVADLDLARAKAKAEEREIPLALSPAELIAHPDVDLVLNLTIPAAHGPVALDAVRAGKHVYNEKPLTVSLDEARELLAVAKEKGVRVGCAPDTFLGSGGQTARAAIDRGLIGTPVGATAAMRARGPEPWHPNPGFFYLPGGGPMLDMGPYYVTQLVNLLGPVRRLAGLSRITFTERPVALSNANYYGDRTPETPDMLPVSTPTHLAGLLEFETGAIGELATSFDSFSEWPSHPITIYGSEGSMKVPDPNTFDGSVILFGGGRSEPETLDLGFGSRQNERGLGVLDMAEAIAEGRPHRASGDLAAHVLEAMLSVSVSSEENRFVTLTNGPRPEPLAPDWRSEERG